MLKSFLLKTFLPVFAFIADFVSIISAINSDNFTVKTMLENPYIRVLFFTLALTALVFLGKYLFTRFTKKDVNVNTQKENLELSSFLYIAMILLCGVILMFAFKKSPIQVAEKTTHDTIYITTH